MAITMARHEAAPREGIRMRGTTNGTSGMNNALNAMRARWHVLLLGGLAFALVGLVSPAQAEVRLPNGEYRTS